MLNFNGITHLIQYPSGRFGYVGSVPTSLSDMVPATVSDIMAGRAIKGFAPKWHVHDTVANAVADAQNVGADLCADPKCACRKLF